MWSFSDILILCSRADFGMGFLQDPEYRSWRFGIGIFHVGLHQKSRNSQILNYWFLRLFDYRDFFRIFYKSPEFGTFLNFRIFIPGISEKFPGLIRNSRDSGFLYSRIVYRTEYPDNKPPLLCCIPYAVLNNVFFY